MGLQRVGHNWATELNWRLFCFLLQLEGPSLFQNFKDNMWLPSVTCWSPNPPVCLYLEIGCSKDIIKVQFSSVQPLSHVQLCNPMDCSMPGFPVHHQFPELPQTHVHRVNDAIQPSHSLSSPSPPAFNFPSIRVFSNELVLHIRWPKYWSFSFSISPSSEYSGLISLRIDWFDLHPVRGTLKSLLHHHNSKASILWCSAFFIVQLSHLYMTTGKTTALTKWTFVGKVMSLLFNMLSRLVIAFLPRSKGLLM